MNDARDHDSAVANIAKAEIVLPGGDLKDTLPFFKDRLGFRLEAIFPADDPAVAVVAGYGLRLRLERGAELPPGTLRLHCADPAALAAGATELTAPNGTRVEFVADAAPLQLPANAPSFVVTRLSPADAWGIGRAGMQYRDLVPDRQGGRFIASHIRIPDGGPVPDMVHFHKIRFQMIFCYRGWVDLLYQDQGPLFRMHAGDCVLQPPEIRHRVVECSPGLEVIEIGCPADHMTGIDHDLELPTAALDPERDFGSQRFLRHQAAETPWQPWRFAGVESRDNGIDAATDGLADARVLRFPASDGTTRGLPPHRHTAEFLFSFLLAGSARLSAAGQADEDLGPGDSFVIPQGMTYALAGASADLESLQVALPANYGTAE